MRPTGRADQCPQLGVERTQRGRRLWAVHDPFATFTSWLGPFLMQTKSARVSLAALEARHAEIFAGERAVSMPSAASQS
jgi:hypothetical protein